MGDVWASVLFEELSGGVVDVADHLVAIGFLDESSGLVVGPGVDPAVGVAGFDELPGGVVAVTGGLAVAGDRGDTAVVVPGDEGLDAAVGFLDAVSDDLATGVGPALAAGGGLGPGDPSCGVVLLGDHSGGSGDPGAVAEWVVAVTGDITVGGSDCHAAAEQVVFPAGCGGVAGLLDQPAGGVPSEVVGDGCFGGGVVINRQGVVDPVVVVGGGDDTVGDDLVDLSCPVMAPGKCVAGGAFVPDQSSCRVVAVPFGAAQGIGLFDVEIESN